MNHTAFSNFIGNSMVIFINKKSYLTNGTGTDDEGKDKK